MSDEHDAVPTRELQERAEQLGDHDWRMVMEAATALASAGQAGLDAVLWGLSHPNARVRRGRAGVLVQPPTGAGFPQVAWGGPPGPASQFPRGAVEPRSRP